MPDLEMLLRDVRPVPNPDWAARLDKRAAAGFPSPPSLPKRFLRGIRSHFAALSLATATVGALFLVVLVISSIDTSSSNNADVGSSGGASAAAPESAKSAGDSASSTADAAVPLSTPD